MATESRLVEFRDMEVKGRNFRGVAAVYDTPWSDKLAKALGYVEEVGRGALGYALGLGENIPLLGAHRRHELLATTEARTLVLADDAGRGLDVNADLPKNYLGDYYREMVHRGDIRGMSWGFESLPEDSIWTKLNGRDHRRIANVQRILDVTLTWEPAYPATVAELRAAGLVVAPLEEIGRDLEESPGEAPTEQPPDADEAASFSRQAVEIATRALEGGFYSERG